MEFEERNFYIRVVSCILYFNTRYLASVYAVYKMYMQLALILSLASAIQIKHLVAKILQQEMRAIGSYSCNPHITNRIYRLLGLSKNDGQPSH